MLSIENPPEPSCFCKRSGLKDDGGAGEKLALQGAADLVEPACLDENQLPQFSIRDYVFTARSKDIGASWPFSQPLLQLCLKHGVKDPLPPFEPPNLVRGHCHQKGVVTTEHLNACEGSEKTLAKTDSLDKEDAVLLDLQDSHTKHKHSQSLDQSVLDQGDNKLCRLSKSLGSNEAGGKGVIASSLTSHVKNNSNSTLANRLTSSLQETNSLSEASIEFEALEPPKAPNKTGSFCGPSDKKCRLIVKLGGVSESGRTEDIVSNSSALSESMASKVCPVCKTFTSTSNTTLNAHIDQCLAVESTCERVLTDLAKHRVKPRKKRLMVDIYVTAPNCTLEDLDRRNGTNWANDSKAPMPNGEIGVESKRQRMSQLDVVDDVDDDRAVYVDSKGTKLRILSKFNDTVAPTLGDDFTQRNHSNDTKKGKIFFIGKKKHLVPKCSKHMKVKPQSKSLCALRRYKDEIEASDEEYRMGNREKERSLSQLLKDQDPIKTGGAGTLRQWVCSKRSCLSKKFSDRDAHRCADSLQLTKSNPSALGSFAKRNNILKFSRLSEEPAASLRSKRIDIPLNSTDDDERTLLRPPESNLDGVMEGASSPDGRMLKFVKYSGSCASSPRSRRVEIKNGTAQPATNLPENHPFSPKVRISSALRKDLLLGKPSLPLGPNKNSEKRKNSIFKRSQNDRCAVEISEKKRRLTSDVVVDYDQMQDSAEILGLCSVNENDIYTAHKVNCFENMVESEIEAITNEESYGRNKIIESEQESEEDVSTSDQEETVISKGFHSAAEYCSLGIASVYSEDGGSFHQYYKSEDEESAADEVTEKAVGNNIVISGETPSSDGNSPAPHADLQSPCLEGGNVGPTCQPILQVLPTIPRQFDDQSKSCIGEEGNNVRAITEVEAGSLTETNSMVIQKLGASFPCPGEMDNEVQENSSVTSSGPHSIQNKHQQVDGDQSGSPSSANSAFFPPPMNSPDFRYMGQQSSSVGPFGIQDKVSLSFSDSNGEATCLDVAGLGMYSALPSTLSAKGAEKEVVDHENLKVATSVKGPMKIPDYQPCCCSLKESISRGAALSYQELQLPGRKGVMTSMMVPPKGRQLTTSNPNIRPEICPSFSTCSGLGLGSNSMKDSSNAAMKLQICRDFGLSNPSSQTLPSPSSTSSPILRLMGKDLMVMSKDEDELTTLQKIPLAPPSDHPNAKYPTRLLGCSNGNVSNQDSFSFSRQSPDDSFLFGLDHPCYLPKNFGVGFSGGVRTVGDYKVVHQRPLQSPVNHQELCPPGFVGSTLQPGSKDGLDKQSQQKTLNRKPNSPLSYNVERLAVHRQRLKPVSASEDANSMMREVILIEDSPELEPNLSSVDANYSVGLRRNQPLPVDISPSPVLSSNSRTTKGFSCFPLQNTFSGELSGGPKPNFLRSCPGANARSSKQGGNAVEGLGILSPSPSILTSPSTGYLNPTLYYPSSFQ
ncbi:hypothetical protein AAC387_Pa09g1151 [Persea americana]